MKSSSVLVIIMLFASVTAVAQKKYATSCLDLNGFTIEKKLTEKQIIAMFGNPDKKDIDGLTGIVSYTYGDSWFSLYDGCLESIHIVNRRFVLFRKTIPGGIRIGDNVAEVQRKLKQYTKDAEFETFSKGHGIESINGCTGVFLVGGGDFYIHFYTSEDKLLCVFYYAGLSGI